jgi:hypothetical protein
MERTVENADGVEDRLVTFRWSRQRHAETALRSRCIAKTMREAASS